jgi:hypothetical protein
VSRRIQVAAEGAAESSSSSNTEQLHNADPQAPSVLPFTSTIITPGKSYAAEAANRVPEPTRKNHHQMITTKQTSDRRTDDSTVTLSNTTQQQIMTGVKDGRS